MNNSVASAGEVVVGVASPCLAWGLAAVRNVARGVCVCVCVRACVLLARPLGRMKGGKKQEMQRMGANKVKQRGGLLCTRRSASGGLFLPFGLIVRFEVAFGMGSVLAGLGG